MRGGSVWFAALLATVAVATAATACVRDPLPGGCPRIEPGALVVSELRGPQNGSYRQWIEVYNAGDTPIAVQGLRFAFTKLDGTAPVAFAVRSEGLEVAPGAYLVLGGGDPEEEDYIDYDYTADYHSSTSASPRDLYGAARLELTACDRVIDQVVYQTLPTAGTLALDGAAPPDAAANDDSTMGWCVDARDDGPKTEIGLRGSPGEQNPPCP